MPPLKKTGTYRPTWKLSLADRQHSKYAHKVIDRIIRQHGRPERARKRGMKKAALITHWMEQDQAIKVEGKPELVADYKSVAGQDGFTPEEWVDLAKELKALANKGDKNKTTRRENLKATKRKRTASEEIRKTKRVKENGDTSSDPASDNGENHEDTDMESDDAFAEAPHPVFGTRVARTKTAVKLTRQTTSLSDNDTGIPSPVRRTRRGNRRAAATVDPSDTEEDFAPKKRTRGTKVATKGHADRRAMGNDDPVRKTAATKKSSFPASITSHPRSVRYVKGGVPGPYTWFNSADTESSGDLQEGHDDDMDTVGKDVGDPLSFANLSAAYRPAEASKKGKMPTSNRKPEHIGVGFDVLPRSLSVSRGKQTKMLQEYTEDEDGDKPEYAEWVKRHGATSFDKDKPFYMPFGTSPTGKQRFEEGR